MKCAYSENGNSKCQFEHIEHIKNVLHLSVLADGKWWCPFHAPSYDKDGHPTEKGDWPDIYRKSIHEKILELREDALAKQEKLDLSGVVFPGDADFQDVEFPEVDFSHARFEGRADFKNTSFIGEFTRFRNTQFGGEANFEEAKFSGSFADFRDTEFSEKVFCIKTRFDGDASFRDALFYQSTTFQDSRFIRNTSFRGVEFKEDAFFPRTEFNGNTSFLGAQFNEAVSFRDANFNHIVRFRNAQFKGNARFQYVQFSRGQSDFRNARFNKKAYFTNSTFSISGTLFRKTEFNRIADFQNTQFNGAANFQNAKFNENARFKDSQFKLWARFIAAQFRGHADFTSSGNNTEIDAFQDEVYFDGAKFLDNANFNNRKFQQSTNFRECFFHKAPRFHNCSLHQETDFADARFLDTSSPGSAMAYRTLKQDMEEKRARQEQLVFYALEMKCRRSEEKRKFLKFISWLYEATSDYGQRIFLPLAWLAFFFLFFALIYAAYFKVLLNLDAASILPQSLRFSIKQIVRPFGVFTSSFPDGIFGKIPPTSLLSLPLIIAATLQSFLSLVLLLLSGLAARWRFKIG